MVMEGRRRRGLVRAFAALSSLAPDWPEEVTPSLGDSLCLEEQVATANEKEDLIHHSSHSFIRPVLWSSPELPEEIPAGLAESAGLLQLRGIRDVSL